MSSYCRKNHPLRPCYVLSGPWGSLPIGHQLINMIHDRLVHFVNATTPKNQLLGRPLAHNGKERKAPESPSFNPHHGPALVDLVHYEYRCDRMCLLVLGYPCNPVRQERLPPVEYEFWHPVDQLFLKSCMSESPTN